jgi:RHS repeat-associated protein
VAWAGAFTAFGQLVEEQRGEARALRVESPFRLLGQVYDEESGLSWTRFRCFDAETGRWLSADPLGLAGGQNLFGWNKSPLRYVDPLGLASVEAHHGADGDKILHMLNTGKMVSDSSGQIFLSGQQADTFVHGADRARSAAFSVKVEVRVPPGGRIERTSRQGNPHTTIVHTPEPNQPVDVSVQSMTARTRRFDPVEEQFVTTTTTYNDPAAIRSALKL